MESTNCGPKMTNLTNHQSDNEYLQHIFEQGFQAEDKIPVQVIPDYSILNPNAEILEVDKALFTIYVPVENQEQPNTASAQETLSLPSNHTENTSLERPQSMNQGQQFAHETLNFPDDIFGNSEIFPKISGKPVDVKINNTPCELLDDEREEKHQKMQEIIPLPIHQIANDIGFQFENNPFENSDNMNSHSKKVDYLWSNLDDELQPTRSTKISNNFSEMNENSSGTSTSTDNNSIRRSIVKNGQKFQKILPTKSEVKRSQAYQSKILNQTLTNGVKKVKNKQNFLKILSPKSINQRFEKFQMGNSRVKGVKKVSTMKSQVAKTKNLKKPYKGYRGVKMDWSPNPHSLEQKSNKKYISARK